MRLTVLLLLGLLLGCGHPVTATLTVPRFDPRPATESETQPCLPPLPRFDQPERDSGWVPAWL